ncbi:MAG: thioredoxin family protein [Bacteroidota bacterium]|nr:thioredoxin family protein [Bacteroidota bacterium]
MKKLILVFITLLLVISFNTFAQNKGQQKVTFIELGSVSCIPCKQMQPIMKSVEQKYGKQVKVTFYDVWKDDQKQYAQKYGVKLIPTQVFLDEKGKEFFRHEGFYPEKEIDKLLLSKGIKPKSGK